MHDDYVMQLLEERRRAAAQERLARQIMKGRRRPARRAIGQSLVRAGLWLLNTDVARPVTV
jgi:hypothetical protein